MAPLLRKHVGFPTLPFVWSEVSVRVDFFWILFEDFVYSGIPCTFSGTESNKWANNSQVLGKTRKNPSE